MNDLIMAFFSSWFDVVVNKEYAKQWKPVQIKALRLLCYLLHTSITGIETNQAVQPYKVLFGPGLAWVVTIKIPNLGVSRFVSGRLILFEVNWVVCRSLCEFFVVINLTRPMGNFYGPKSGILIWNSTWILKVAYEYRSGYLSYR